MTATLTVAALWVALALIAGLLSYSLRVSAALMEIVIGVAAQQLLGPEISVLMFLRGILRDRSRAVVIFRWLILP